MATVTSPNEPRDQSAPTVDPDARRWHRLLHQNQCANERVSTGSRNSQARRESCKRDHEPDRSNASSQRLRSLRWRNLNAKQKSTTVSGPQGQLSTNLIQARGGRRTIGDTAIQSLFAGSQSPDIGFCFPTTRLPSNMPTSSGKESFRATPTFTDQFNIDTAMNNVFREDDKLFSN